MDNQELKNLHHLDSHEALLKKSTTSSSIVSDSSTADPKKKDERRSTIIIQQHITVDLSTQERDAVTEGTLNLNRAVTIKQFAPNVFREIRRLNNISDEDLMKSLDPAENVKNI